MRSNGHWSPGDLHHWVRQGLARSGTLLADTARWFWSRAAAISGLLVPARLRSSHPLARYAPLVLVPVLAAAVVIPLLPGSPPGHQAGVTPADPPAMTFAAQQTPPALRPVTLLTGDVVRMTAGPGGRSAVSVLPPKPKPGAVDAFADTFKVGGDVYAVPGAALPSLGSRLDPRLFDVSYLQRAGYTGLKALPLTITWRSATHSQIPGLSAPGSGLQTSGSVSIATAAAFGQALAESGPGHNALAQVKKISLGPPPAASAQNPADMPQVAPAAPLSSISAPAGTKMFTLTVNAVDTTGQPGYAEIAVQNLDNFARYHTIGFAAPGEPVSVSVPAGHYGIEAFVYDTTQQLFGLPENLAFVPVPEISVVSDTLTTVDAQQAKPINITVPDSTAVPQIAGMVFTRLSADSNGLENAIWTWGPGLASGILPPVHMFAVPTPAPRTGSLGFADSFELTPPDSGLGGVDPPFSYSLDFASPDGVPAALSHTLTQADLATVHENLASSVDSSSPYSSVYFNMTPFHPWSTLGLALIPGFFGTPVPAQRTDYFSSSDTTAWALQSQVTQFPAPAVFGAYRTFRAGDNLSLTWGASPSVPAPEWQSMGLPDKTSNNVGGDSPVTKLTWSYVCPVCRQGDVMEFNVPFSGDSDPTHTESWFGFGSGAFGSTIGPPTDTVKFYRNGTLTQLSGRSGEMFPMLPGKADYTIDWAETIPVLWTRLATSVHSVWTFSSARPSGADTLPGYELCSPDTTQPCSFVPLVFARYDFGADLQGQVAAPGAETFTLTGYHQANENTPPVTSATVQASFDDGATWAPASSVTALGGGRFKVTVTQPDPSAGTGYASFKVTLTDAAGDALTQTIIRAYALASPAAVAAGRTAAAHETAR